MDEEIGNVKQRLLEIGRKEFLDNGYVKASMRKIGALANVTTGAIYFFFRNKEEFFRAILDETAIEWKRRLQEYSESEINGSKISAENDRELISISDKTVSKWECGKGLPEVSLMLPLCDILRITVNCSLIVIASYIDMP